MTVSPPKTSPARKRAMPTRLSARQECALAFVTGMLAGPAGKTTLAAKNGDALVQLSRLSLKFADVFLREAT